ncbi:MerR family transcriptional regulator [Rhodobacteraceae bacterium nBUS_24]
MGKSAEAFRTISEVAEWLGIPTHVLRFWESKFTQIKPVKRGGGRRYYRPSDMLLIGGIRKLLHEDGMTIKGAQKILREKGIKHVSGLSPSLDMAETPQSEQAPEQADPIEQSKPASPQDNVIKLDRKSEIPTDIENIDDQEAQTALNFWSNEDPNGDEPKNEPIVANTAGLIAAIKRLSPIASEPGDKLHAISAELKAELERRRANDQH